MGPIATGQLSIFLLLYSWLALSEISDPLVAGGPGLALRLKSDGDHVLFNNFDFGSLTVEEITVEMWLLSSSKETSFTPFSYSTKAEPLSFVWSGLEEVWVLGEILPLHFPAITLSEEVADADTGEWHHYSISWRSSDGLARLLFDHNLWAEGVLSTTIGKSIPQGGSFVLGQFQGKPGHAFDRNKGFSGLIDEIRVWNSFTSPLLGTPGETSFSCAQPRLSPPDSLISCWTMDESFLNVGNANAIYDFQQRNTGKKGYWDSIVDISSYENDVRSSYSPSAVPVVNNAVPTIVSLGKCSDPSCPEPSDSVDVQMLWSSNSAGVFGLLFNIVSFPTVATIKSIEQQDYIDFPEDGTLQSMLHITPLWPLFFDSTSGNVPQTFMYSVTDGEFVSFGKIVIRYNIAPQALEHNIDMLERKYSLIQLQCDDDDVAVPTVHSYPNEHCTLYQVEDAGMGRTIMLDELIPPADVFHHSGKLAAMCFSQEVYSVSEYAINYSCRDSFVSGSPGVTTLSVSPTNPVVVGTAQWALFFDGTGEYASARLNAPFKGIRTIEMYIRLQGEDSEMFFSKSPASSVYTLLSFVDSTSYLSVSITPDLHLAIDVDGELFVDPVGIIPKDEWSAIAITFAGGNVTFYVDLLKTGEVTIPVETWSFTELYLGASPNRTQFFWGMVDDFRLWSTVRNRNDFDRDSRRKVPKDTTGLLGYWACDEGQGISLSPLHQQNTTFGFEITLGNGTYYKPNWVVSGIPQASTFQTEENSPIVIQLYGKSTTDRYGYVITKLPINGTLYQYDPHVLNNTGSQLKRSQLNGTALFLWEEVNEVSQWVSRVNNVSSVRSPSFIQPKNAYSAEHLIGPPYYFGDAQEAPTPESEDRPDAWAPRYSCSPNDLDWIDVSFDTPVFVTRVEIYESYNAGSVVSVAVYNEETHVWQTLWTGNPTNLYEDEFRVFVPSICQTPWKTSRMRIEMDTCKIPGWNQIAGVRLYGSSGMRTDMVSDVQGRIIYDPTGAEITEDYFEYAVVVCPPFGQTSSSATVTVLITQVQMSPESINFTVNATENEQNTIALKSIDLDEGDVLVYVIQNLPQRGTLYRADFQNSATRGPAIEPSSGFLGGRVVYVPDPSSCGMFNDHFSYTVSDGITSSEESKVTINVFCEPGRHIFPTPVILVICVFTALAIITCAILISWVVYNRKKLRGEKSVFLVIMLVGFMISLSYNFFQFAPLNDAICAFQTWFTAFGTMLVAAGAFVRTFALWKEALWLLSKKKRHRVTKTVVIWLFVTPCVLNIALLSLYMGLAPPKVYHSPDSNNAALTWTLCTYSEGFLGSIVAIQMFILFINAIFTTVSGMMTKNYAEVYPAYALIILSGVSITFFTNLAYDWDGTVWFTSISVILTALVPMGLLFTPKIYFFSAQNPSDDLVAQLNSRYQSSQPETDDKKKKEKNKNIDADSYAQRDPSEEGMDIPGGVKSDEPYQHLLDQLQQKNIQLYRLQNKLLKKQNIIKELQQKLEECEQHKL
eukprot:TRINITY_DN6457_c0_g1_i1.p1 TRINITY_DN6457_c0_g1~~TRINITY_DN6457_c0_g1_i1.p1  ORF type:complete len:1506 (-),score=233.62 TRINITY_DN6457_c0_g1_i1:200-4717(-)